MIESDDQFIFDVEILTGKNMSSINAFLKDSENIGIWKSDIGSKNLEYLLELREKAYFAYKGENIQLMEAYIEALFAWLTHLSFHRDAHPRALQGMNFIRSQQKRAKKERNSIKVDNEKLSINHLIKNELYKLKDELGDPIPPKDLWNELISRLDKLNLHPEESIKNKHPVSLSFFADDDQTKRKNYKFSSFKSEISKARKNKLI